MRKLKRYLVAWWCLSRVPFLSMGILPLILGYVLAWRWGYKGPITLYFLSSTAVILIMGMTLYLRERNGPKRGDGDRPLDRLSGRSGVAADGVFPNRVLLVLGYGCLAGAVFLGFHIYWQYRTGPWTLFLGGIGIFFGFFYSGKPFRWSYRGAGEIVVAFCCGWLPIATGFYLFTGFFIRQVFLISVPLALSVFNVILINEFQDEEGDRFIGKRNLVVRFGKERMADLYLGVSSLMGLSFIKVMVMLGPVPFWLYILSGIPLILILLNLVQVWREGYRDAGKLGLLCRNTLLVNLSLAMILTIQQTLILSGPGIGRE